MKDEMKRLKKLRKIIRGGITRGGVQVYKDGEKLWVKMGHSGHRHEMGEAIGDMWGLYHNFSNWAQKMAFKIVEKIHKNGYTEDIKLEVDDLYEDISCFEKVLQAYNEAWTAQCIYWEDKIDCRTMRFEAA